MFLIVDDFANQGTTGHHQVKNENEFIEYK